MSKPQSKKSETAQTAAAKPASATKSGKSAATAAGKKVTAAAGSKSTAKKPADKETSVAKEKKATPAAKKPSAKQTSAAKKAPVEKAPVEPVSPVAESPKTAVEEPSTAPKGRRKRTSSRGVRLPRLTGAMLKELFPDAIVLQDAFRKLVDKARHNGGYVTNDDIFSSLPSDVEGSEDQDSERLFESLHAFGVEVRDETFSIAPISFENLRPGAEGEGGSIANSPSVNDKVKELILQAKEQGYLTFDDINDVLPSNIISPEDYEQIMERLRECDCDIIDASDVDNYSDRSTLASTGETLLASTGETLRGANPLSKEETSALVEKRKDAIARYLEKNKWLKGGPGFTRGQAWVIKAEADIIPRERHLLRTLWMKEDYRGQSLHCVDNRYYDCLYILIMHDGEPYRLEQWFDITAYWQAESEKE